MGNSHISGRKTRPAKRHFRDRAFDLKSWLERRDQVMGVREARKKFGACVPSKIAPGTFARPGRKYASASTPVEIDILTPRSGLAYSQAWRDRIPGSTFGRNQLVIRRSSDVEQWKHIPRKAESRTPAFL